MLRSLKMIEKIGASITRKVPKSNAFDHLTNGEKVFVYIDIFEKEMKNGDFDQFFFNASGEFTHEILAAYEAIGAHSTVDILYRAILLFPSIPVPKDEKQRRYFLGGMSIENQARLTDLERQFYETDEDIVALLHRFIITNATQFDL